VIETPFPRDAADNDDLVTPERRLEEMGNAVALVDDVGETRIPESTEIVGLPAGSWIERGLIEVDTPAFVRDGYDTSVEAGEVGIRVVQALGTHDAGLRLRAGD
jgi:hypothetical protein